MNELRPLARSPDCCCARGACATGPRPGAAPRSIRQAQAVEAYRIGVDDVIQVSVWQNPDLNVTVPVRPDGRISVPLVGDVEAGGRTPEEVSAEIKTKLETFVRNPQVTVILTSCAATNTLSRVRVTGAVRKPVSIPYRQGMTVLDAVLAAGGTNEFAAADSTELYRKEGDATRAYRRAPGPDPAEGRSLHELSGPAGRRDHRSRTRVLRSGLHRQSDSVT